MTEERVSEWTHRMLGLAEHIGRLSMDRSIGVGCVVEGASRSIISLGFNGFPRGVADDVDQRHERPQKYLWTEHAERNAIYNAARNGIRLESATMYVPWFPCAACARAIVQVGISRLVALAPDWKDPTWAADFEVSRTILDEGGVVTELLDGEAVGIVVPRDAQA